MKTLSKTKQLAILAKVEKAIKESVKTKDSYVHYLCNTIEYYVEYSDNVHEIIPSFNYENVCRICHENDIAMPDKDYGVWWILYNSEYKFGSVEYAVEVNSIRLRVIEVLIKKLKTK